MLEIVEEPLEVGSVIAGAYRLERVLGEGGMGVVWAARELTSPGSRRVALKFLREGNESDARNQERFLREARVMMRLAHPSIVKLEAVVETDAGSPVLVMELLEGESLRDALLRRGSLDAVECARVFLPVIDAVEAAHGHGIIHRDLKPENVFLQSGATSDVRVLDFGVAKAIPSLVSADPSRENTKDKTLTSTGALLGTPLYMSPEQIYGDELDGRSDVWSLGVMIYECLAGERPTEGDGFGPVIKRITSAEFVPLGVAKPGLPRALAAVVDRMLERDRAKRPTLDEVRAVLVAVREGKADAPEARDATPTAPRHAMVSALASTKPDPMGTTTTAGVASRHASDVESAFAPARKTKTTRSIAIAAAAVLLLSAGYMNRARLFGSPGSVPGVSPPSGSTNPGQEFTEHWQAVTAAMNARDSAACTKHLDAIDASPHRVGPRTTDPSSGLATTRSMCMMLTGECDRGKALYLAAVTYFSRDAAPSYYDQATELTAAAYCEGDNLTPRDGLIRAYTRLNEMGAGTRQANVDACKRYQADEQRLLPLVQPKAPDDVVATLGVGAASRAARCFAQAGDCATARALFEPDWLRQNEPYPNETAEQRTTRMLQSFDILLMMTPCKR